MSFRELELDDLAVDDENSFRHVALYGQLKAALRASRHRFRVPVESGTSSWDRVLFLNLTYWSGSDESSVLCDDHVAPDVIAHTAWHHVSHRELGRLCGAPLQPPGAASAAALFFSEALASAFDLYLVGRLLENAPESDFITTQVPVMAQAAEEAGMSDAAFAMLLESIAADPERAFEDMRALLLDAGRGLYACHTADDAQAVLEGFIGHRRFEPLLHHFQLSNWILYARAYAAPAFADDAAKWDDAVRAVDETLRAAPVSLDWLAEHWLNAPDASS